MGIKIRTNRYIYIIDIEGDMEFMNSNMLKELVLRMAEKKVERFIINAEKVSSIDSSGIGAFIYVLSTLKKMQLSVAIAGVNSTVKTAIGKAKLDSYFPMYDEIDEAIQKISG